MSDTGRAGISGRSILILGGTSGIGVAIAEGLLGQQPGPVVIAARDLDRGAVVADQLRAAGATETFVIRFDAAEAHEAERAVAEAATLLGRIDVAIVAFGIFATTETLAGDLDAMLQMVRVNLMGAIAVGEALSGTIRTQGSGGIIAVSSRSIAWTESFAGVYSATKVGFDHYFLSLGLALRPAGGGVLVVRPPGVNTGLIEHHSSFHSPEDVAVEVVQAFSTDRAELTILNRHEQRLAQRSLPRKVLDRTRHDLGRVRRRVLG